MREELIGYLLGALDAKEQVEVEQTLSNSETLRQELEELALDLRPLEADADVYDPPVGLASRTCAFVERHRTELPVKQRRARPPVEPLSGKSRDRLITTGRWSLTDTLVAAGVCAVAVLLFLPALAESRHQASLAYCQNNLREVSTGLGSYSEANRGYLPAVPAEGRFSFAGIYAPILLEQGFMTDPSNFFCSQQPRVSSAEEPAFPPHSIPTRSQLSAADGRELAEMVRRSGGDYAYVVGYVEDGELQAIRNQARENFAILSDAPNLDGTSRVSANHGGDGMNVLFEDGHIGFVTSCQLDCGDNLFLNDAGHSEAGMHQDDAVLGHSSMPPVHRVMLELDR